ncbi:hypothetical protein CK203_100700 [Vitis vinifera]|uniref:Uncharacterized protein n=1 Tax=Vitis vinifera TaxID=29760 RepID=A0A438FI40_VITVI|nr:hypothetical protein CK203_100700 [Vitis vinifera]
MAGGNFMHRVISYVVNEVLVNSLANSPAFQIFAVRTSRRMEDISNKAAQKRQELAEQVKELSKNFESPKNQKAVSDLESRQRVFERESTKWCSGSSVVAEIGEAHGSEARGEWEEKEWLLIMTFKGDFTPLRCNALGIVEYTSSHHTMHSYN